jgi:2'-5' RNA ligase
MDHVIAPLDADHARAVRGLAEDLAAALAVAPEAVSVRTPHITVASYTGLEPAGAAAALGPVAAATRQFTVRAHGYGIFTGDADSDLSLYVVVVRSRALDELHGRVHASLDAAGACLAGTTHASVWSPHVTVLDRGLTPSLLGRAIEVLAHRPHRTWSISVASLTIASRHGDLRHMPATLALGPAAG